MYARRAARSSPSRAAPTTSRRRSRSPARTACRSSRAAAARAWPARPRAGAASCSTTRATCDAIGEIDVAGRRVRVEPGVVQEDLNRRRAAARARLRAGHLDRQPGHARRHDRQQLLRAARRSSTAPRSTTCSSSRSCSADGSRATFGALDEAEWARRAQADTLEGAIRRGLPGIAERPRPRDRRGLPEALAPVGRLPARPLRRLRRPATSRSSSRARRARSSRSPPRP